jgi:hypothetical protein
MLLIKTIGRFQLEKYALFEQGLKDLYDVAKHLRTNSCYINGQNGTDGSSTGSPSTEGLSGNVVSGMCLSFDIFVRSGLLIRFLRSRVRSINFP